MLRKILLGSVLGLLAITPSHAGVVYSASAGPDQPLNGTSTPELGYLPSFNTQVTFSYNSGDSGTLVDELAAGGGWHDSQLEVQANGSILSSVWSYQTDINLGVASSGSNTVSYGYNAATQTLFGQLNNGPVVSTFFGVREDPYSNWPGQQFFAFGVGDSTNLGTYGNYTNNITGVTISSSVGAVPEISTWAMMLAGFAGLGFAGYRRRSGATAA